MESLVGGRSLLYLLAGASSLSDSTSLAFAPVVGGLPDTLCTLCTEVDLPSRWLSRPSSLCHGIMAIISRFRDCPPFSDLASACPTLGRCSGASSDISSPGGHAQNANAMMSSPPVPFAVMLRCYTFALDFRRLARTVLLRWPTH